MIARENPDGTWTAMTLEAALEFVMDNPYVPMVGLTPEAAAEFRARVARHRAEHGVRPATSEEIRVLEAWKELKARKAAAKERGWTFSTIERVPGTSHILTIGHGDPRLASDLASMSILHQAERQREGICLTDSALSRLLDQVETHDRAR